MKKTFPILFLLLVSSSLFSQQEHSNPKNDFGINVNAVLNKIIFKKINDEITNPFPDQLSILTYRHFVSEKIAIRFGLGYDQFLRSDSTFTTFSGPIIEDKKFRFYAVHFGIQKNIIDYKKVKLSIGWDWIFRRELQERSSNDFFFTGGIALQEGTFTDFYKESSLGFGIPLGIQYYFNDRIFISTEFGLEVFQKHSKNKSEIDGSTSNEYQDNPDIFNMNFRPPLALFIHYRF